MSNLLRDGSNYEAIEDHTLIEDCANKRPKGIDPAWSKLLRKNFPGDVLGLPVSI